MSRITRRSGLVVLAGALTSAILGSKLSAQSLALPAINRNNVSGFRIIQWQDHFPSLGPATIIADISSRALQFWSGDGKDYRIYPISIPMSDALTKRGKTQIVRKRIGPDWTPTADMRRRDPSLPAYMPPGPDNPLGTHALYLSWPAYLIHGTHDTRKIGRKSSSGCVGLYNQQIVELFDISPVGTQVLLL